MNPVEPDNLEVQSLTLITTGREKSDWQSLPARRDWGIDLLCCVREVASATTLPSLGIGQGLAPLPSVRLKPRP